jgi:hypothetical protein
LAIPASTSTCIQTQSSHYSHHAWRAEKTPIIASDGSVRQNMDRGTFAWVLALADGTPWLRCKGPVGGFQVEQKVMVACCQHCCIWTCWQNILVMPPYQW